MSVRIDAVTEENLQVFNRLMQSYECEFSSITGKKPKPDGTFDLDTHLDQKHLGFLGYLENIPFGFSLIRLKEGKCFEVCEFFVVPAFRKQQLGFELSRMLWDRFPGRWEIKQIAGAEGARAFWRRTVARYTSGRFEEDEYADPYWGPVTRQCFSNAAQTP